VKIPVRSHHEAFLRLVFISNSLMFKKFLNMGRKKSMHMAVRNLQEIKKVVLAFLSSFSGLNIF